MSATMSGGASAATIFIGISAITLLVSVFSPGAFSGARTATSDFFYPMLNTVVQPVQYAAEFVRNATGLAELQAENIRLQKENDRLREWYQAALVLEAENKSLRNLMNVKLEPHNKYISARVLTDYGQTFARSLMVGAGHNDGVRKGQSVISGDGLVGRIIDVGERTSRILLVTDYNSRIPILIENTSRHAIMTGGNEAMPTLRHLPPDYEITEGARIITSGLGGMFPYGIPVGRVTYSENGNRSIKLFADTDHMTFVRIVDKDSDPNLQRPGEGTALSID